MLKKLIGLTFLLFLSTCTDDNITIVKEPGALTGFVLPPNIGAEVTLVQGTTEIKSKVENDGRFKIKDIEPGVYTFIANANNFGSQKKENIKIEDGEGYEIGTIELDTIPYPLTSISDLYLNARDRNNDTYFTISFKKFMSISSLERYISIHPTVENFRISTNSTIGDSRAYYRFDGDYNSGIEYTVSLDTNIETYWGEHLEFTYIKKLILSAQNEFKIEDIYTENIISSNSRIDIRFTNSLDDNFEQHIAIEPAIPLQLQHSGGRLSIYPLNSWIPNTEFNLKINKNLANYDSTKLGIDTIITFRTPKLEVINSSPKDGQILLIDIFTIKVEMNFMIDPASLLNNYITIDPEVEFSIGYTPRFHDTEIYLTTENFSRNTQYTVTITENLKDYWGNNLSEPYSFTFKTNK